MEGPKLKALAFDFDGVIAKLEVDWNDLRRECGVSEITRFYQEQFGTERWKTVSDKIEKAELKAVSNSSPLIGRKWFAFLVSEGLDLYIVTMQTRKVVETYLKKHQIFKYFKDVLTRECYPSKKVMLQQLAKKYPPDQILLVDDREQNIKECKALGIQVLKVGN